MLHASPVRLTSQARTDAGTVRARNEDALLERPEIGLWAVADGMGGHAAGDEASRRVVDALAALPPPRSPHDLLDGVRAGVEQVDAELRAAAAEAGEDVLSGSTVVALMVVDDCYCCLWAGDSRLYRRRRGRLERLTRDDSLVQDLVDAGMLAPERARTDRRSNILTRAVGCTPSLRLNFTEGRVEPGDVFLLCTDGLTQALEEAQINARLDAPNSTDALVDAALAAGASDNVTAVVVRA